MANFEILQDAVYGFFGTGQSSTVVTRRRYPPGGSVTGPSGLRSRGQYFEAPVRLFKVPVGGGNTNRGGTRSLNTQGAQGDAQRVLYARTPFFATDEDIDQPADVVFTTDGRAWEVKGVNAWQTSENNPASQQYAVTIEWTGRRKGEAPFDA